MLGALLPIASEVEFIAVPKSIPSFGVAWQNQVSSLVVYAGSTVELVNPETNMLLLYHRYALPDSGSESASLYVKPHVKVFVVNGAFGVI